MKGKILVILTMLFAFFMLLPEPSINQTSGITIASSDNKNSNSKVTAFSQNLIILNVHLYHGNRQYEQDDVSIVDYKVAAIAHNLPVQSIYPEINGADKTLLPGLIDSHTHVFQNTLLEALHYGVNPELDMRTMPNFANQYRHQRALQSNVGHADLFSVTIMATAPGRHGTQFSFDIPVLASVEQVPQFVDDRIAQGADYIKAVYGSQNSKIKYLSSINSAILKALVDRAHQYNRMLVVHVDDLISATKDIMQIWKNGTAYLGKTHAAPDDPAKKFENRLFSDFNHSNDGQLNQTNIGSGIAANTDE
jgi:hypothetical protein